MEQFDFRRMSFYQIWIRSFADGNGDGVGDLYGVYDKLDYIASLGVDGIWFSPIYPSPNADYGYDISDYRNIHPDYGTLEQFQKVLDRAHALGLRVIMDLVINHTSDEHPWFLESRKSRTGPYSDYYIWRDPKWKGESRLPPNNWFSQFEGLAWEYCSEREQYYLHVFAKKQPDLNMDNPRVREEVKGIMRFWLDMGVDGFREDVITYISKHPQLPDGIPFLPIINGQPYYKDGPNLLDYLREFREVAKEYGALQIGEAPMTPVKTALTYLTGEDVVVPLDELLTDRSYGLGGSQVRFDAPAKGDIVPQFLQELSIGGHLYGLPYMRSTEVLYVNKDLVEALGYELPEEVSWDFVWEVSEKTMEKGDDGNFLVNGQKVMIPFIDYSTDNMLIQLCKQKGSGYSTAAGEVLLFNDDTKEFLYAIAEHAKTGAFSTFKISSYPGNFLNAGQCIFALDSTGGSTWIGTHAPLMDISPDKVVDFETAVLPIPQLNPDEPWMISQGPSVCIFNKADPQEVLASWLFVQYLLTDKVQIAYSQTEGYVPVTTKAQNAPEYLDYLSRAGEDYNEHYDVKIAASKLLLANIDHTFITPVFNGSSSVRSAAGQLIENVTKSMRRKETVDEAYMDKLYEGVTDRSSRVATFLAVLELTRYGRITISDDNMIIYFKGNKNGVRKTWRSKKSSEQ